MIATSSTGQAKWRNWALALFLLAFLLRGLVPAGWMPADSVNGLQLAICTQDAVLAVPAEQLLPGDDQVPPSSPDHNPCSFSGLGIPLLAVAVAGVVGHRLQLPASWSFVGSAAAVENSRRHIWPPSQAPPPSI